jgi:hypothetical protein
MHRPVVRTSFVLSGRRCAHRLRAFLPATGSRLATSRRPLRLAFTLIEVLVAMVVTLILMGIVVTIFGAIGTGVSNSHATMDMSDQLRTAKNRLQVDLAGVTAQMLPPRRPEYGEGYFEIIDGPAGRLAPAFSPSGAYGTSANTVFVLDGNTPPVLGPDTTVGDNDDILMFTTRKRGEPFTGRYYDPVLANDTTVQSQVAEVAWFIRGTTLYRRQLLVRPDLNEFYPSPPAANLTTPRIIQPANYPAQYAFYGHNDLSVHAAGSYSIPTAPPTHAAFDLSPTPPTQLLTVANSLSDLTNRENRLFHRPLLVLYSGIPATAPSNSPYGWPHDARGWGVFYSNAPYGYAPGVLGSAMTTGRLGLPTLSECSSQNWFYPGTVDLVSTVTTGQQILLGANSASGNPEVFDAWDNPNPPLAATMYLNNASTPIDPLSGTLSHFLDAPNSSPFPPRLADDIVLTNVLSFDVRVWDPTAWTIAMTDLASPPNTATYAPGDPGYAQAVLNYVGLLSGSGNFSYSLVSQGAYVDLNYYASIVNCASAHSINLAGLGTSAQLLLAGVSFPPSSAPVMPPLFPCPVQSPTSAQLNTYLLTGTLPAPAMTSTNSFFGPGDARSRLDAYQRDATSLSYLPSSNSLSIPAAAIYDTGSWSYEHDGIDQDYNNFYDINNNLLNITDQGTNGVDDNLDGVVDDPGELEAPPPYTAPLRGIQVKIRCFDPDSKQIREVTIIQEFVSE